jgi:7-carboxy-7-deazaguanine synthase
MRIAEIFHSIQGEGRLTGTESIFVRTSGCNLRCRYCDTPYASWTPEGEQLSVAEVLQRIDQSRRAEPPPRLADFSAATGSAGAASGDVRHVVLTGGEPMLFAELIPLTASLHAAGWHITIETSGTLYLPVACDLMSISPKLSNSTPTPQSDPQWRLRHTLHRHAPEIIRRLTAEFDCQLKFVVDRPEDCHEVEAYLAEFAEIPASRIMLMPQGADAETLADKSAWLEPYCRQRGFHFCPRRQIEWFGAERGT